MKHKLKGKVSAGVLLYRCRAGLEVLLAHAGGPFWRRKDDGAWMLPKGEIQEGEDARAAAQREFIEETGHNPQGTWFSLGSLRQSGGKLVHAWAVNDDWNPDTLVSNTFSLEWPPHSGRSQTFPEIDRAQWFDLETARTKIIKSQTKFLDRLAAELGREQGNHR